MSKRETLEHHLVIVLLLLLPLLFPKQANLIGVGASSTPKNLVNLYTNSPNDSYNITSSNQHQNEYQFRPGRGGGPKSASSDRHKPSTPTNAESIFDHQSSDSSTGTLDYSYLDNRGATNVPDCKGRIKLNGTRGFINDGQGLYLTNLQCIWLIDSGRDNGTIRIQFHEFNTECNYDYLYIFDGDSIYSPLVAALSGDMKDFSAPFFEARLPYLISAQGNQSNSSSTISWSMPTSTTNTNIPPISSESRPFELKTTSGKAFIYFHSDTAQSMPGFHLTYTIDSCPLDCSNRGECDYSSSSCSCKSGYYGNGCQHVYCPNNCTSQEHGYCDREKFCVCNKGYSGLDCSVKDDQVWLNMDDLDQNVLPRAFHQAVVVDKTMWIIGGKTQLFSNTNMGIYRKMSTPTVLKFDIESGKWSNSSLEGVTNVDHLAELSGHSVAAKGHKIFIYGGMSMNNTVLDTLTVIDTKTDSQTSLSSGKQPRTADGEFSPPIAVVGHTANIIDSHMYVFLGYNPLYGYINFVQKFNLADNSWSFVERKGSSVDGCIGHTSTFDPIGRLVYIYGGHHAHRSKNLYSFDPHTGIWTFLQMGPSPRYYHSAVITGNQLIILGGNSYNTSHPTDQTNQCFQQTYLTYDLTCSRSSTSDYQGNSTISTPKCGRNCWRSIESPDISVLKRHGHSVVSYDRELILFGGFNGILMNDTRSMNLRICENLLKETDCVKPKLALNCYWNAIETKCEDQPSLIHSNTSMAINSELAGNNCSKNEIKSLQNVCETRETCTDCLNTNIGCVWCAYLSQCQYSKCKSSNNKAILDSSLCYREEFMKGTLMGLNFGSNVLKDLSSQDIENEMECKRLNSCYLCHSRPHCSWQNDICIYNTPSVIPSQTSSLSPAPQDDLNDMYSNHIVVSKPPTISNTSRFMQRLDPLNRSFLAAFTGSFINSSPYNPCDIPCYMRQSCNECTQTTKCIWCSTSDQCMDSSAYFAYHAMGQCMHYVAHMLKCPVASCADIQTCDKCLTNPKCGWLNDISNSGKGRCIEGTSAGPIFTNSKSTVIESPNNSSSTGSTDTSLALSSWFFTSCPLCQCNGHSYCKPNSNVCLLACQNNTEGPHCEKCIPGYYGDPINGGLCRPCRCNGHAQSCHRETGKCYCSTKGIVGHYCNKCDDQNHYIGDLSSPGNGTCYYNLTTDYQYTFNMSKPEDHFYSDINFINIPLRRDQDVDFTIACSRIALVNITSGVNYKNRRAIHTSLECGSFRLRFSHDRHSLTEANYSFFVHVYKFQTPFILQIAFSQHRTLYLPQFFFTFSSCFLFFFALSGLVWKLKHEYYIYVRRQQQFIEMEQMASRPFSTILLELFKPSADKTPDQSYRQVAEPTPISFEPCFGSNVGVLSLFVQLPGRPNLAIGSALVSLNDETGNTYDDNNSGKRLEKENVTLQNI